MNPNSNNNVHSAELLASCGFIFPSTEDELRRFNMLHGDAPAGMTGIEVDPFRILQKLANEKAPKVIRLQKVLKSRRLVATKLKSIPPHIAAKLGRNDPKG